MKKLNNPEVNAIDNQTKIIVQQKDKIKRRNKQIKKLKEEIKRVTKQLDIYETYTDQIEFTDEDRKELNRLSIIE